jgi:hypothetical protein
MAGHILADEIVEHVYAIDGISSSGWIFEGPIRRWCTSPLMVPSRTPGSGADHPVIAQEPCRRARVGMKLR